MKNHQALKAAEQIAKLCGLAANSGYYVTNDGTIDHNQLVDRIENILRNATSDEIEWTRIKNDSNGNPRFVCHFLHFCTDAEKGASIPCEYENALKRARKIGGRKFHNKQYGGGIVFQSYSLDDTEKSIRDLMIKENAK